MKKEKKSKLGKIILWGSVASLILQNGYAFSSCNYERKIKDMGVSISDDASYGGLNNEGFMMDYSLAKVGNYKETLNDYAKKLLENESKPTGIIIDTEAIDLADIYKELNYAKELVSTYNVEYPIVLNINSIYENNYVEKSEIYLLVDAFVKKAQVNGLTIYVVGNDSYMRDLIKDRSFDINACTYPIGVIYDKEIKEVNLEYDLVISDYYVYSSKDYTKVDNLNTKDTFVKDLSFAANSNTIKDLCKELGMSVSQVIKYNNLQTEKIGDVKNLTFPNKYGEEYIKGIDISSYQGNINFKKLKDSGVKFVIQRAAFTYSGDTKEYIVDTTFNHNSKELAKNNIPEGVYYHTNATSFDEMMKETDLLLKTIEGYDINLPVYIGLYGNILDRFNDVITRSNELELLEYFCNRIISAGYTPGIYIPKDYNIYLERLKGKATIWNYGGDFYNKEQSIYSPYITRELSDSNPIVQCSIKGDGFEIGMGSKDVCIDYATSDYVKTKKMN